MKERPFSAVAATAENPHFARWCQRRIELYDRQTETRSDFVRDYTRILHSTAYRRLKHKTQVFFNTQSDHICTRIEHVGHVESVSGTIAAALGLNTDLTRAIATGHDLGHSPFGHEGERILRKLSEEHLGEDFWHEKNGMYLVDHLELLEDDKRTFRNLNLTYAVRDGILSHCGELNENGLLPRATSIDLADFERPGQYQPATFEGCVVKLADKIAYLGRDIEDAQQIGLLSAKEEQLLRALAKKHGLAAINTTVLMHDMITDVCEHSSPESGLFFGERYQRLMDDVKDFNTTYIYKHPRLHPFCRYARLVLEELFAALADTYAGPDTLHRLMERQRFGTGSALLCDFALWLAAYVTAPIPRSINSRLCVARYENEKIYGDLTCEKDFLRAVRDYVAGMTDGYAIRMFEELLNLA